MSLVKFVVCLVCNAMCFLANSQEVIDYQWKQVPIGGGGYIIGMQVHPDDGNVRYFRTDIGGAYRWNDNEQKLEQLLFFGNEKAHYYGVAGIALDPNNVNRLILAVGRYCDPNQTAILISNDRGETWSQEIVPGKKGASIYFASNGGRGCSGGGADQDRQGAPITLNPNDPNELFIGARGTGLWSLDISAEVFTQRGAPQLPNNTFPNSIRTLEFHPINTQYLFIAYAGQGLYRFNTTNSSVILIDGSDNLKDISDLSISKNGDYMLMACKRKGIFKATNIVAASPPPAFKVLDYTGVNRNDDEAFLTVTCHPNNNALAITAFSDWSALSTVRMTTNSGQSWSGGLPGTTFDNAYPWHNTGEGSHISQFRFDPDNPSGLYFTSWFTTYYTSNFNANPIRWTNKYSKGHEETVITDITAFPLNVQNNFLGATAGDQTGFLYASINDGDYPDAEVSDYFDDDSNQVKGTSMDYCFSNSDHIVVATTKNWDDVYENGVLKVENTGNIFHSTDGGASFTKSTNYDITLGRSVVAVASNNPEHVVIANQDGLWYSSDYGANFTHSTNVSSDNGVCTDDDPINATGSGHSFTSAVNTSVFSTVRPIAADKVLSCVFYFYDRNDGSFHVSTDYGQSFFKVYDGFPNFAGNRWRHKTRVIPVQDHARHVWINFKDDLYYTTNAGENWTRVAGVQKAETLAIGKQMTNGTYPTIFMFGKANNDSTYGYYRSVNRGQTWNLIHNPANKENWGSCKVMGADMEVEGRVYFSSGGLGLLYGDDESISDTCDPQNVLTNHSFESGFTGWQTRTSNTGVASFNTVSNPSATDGALSAEVGVTSLGANHWDIQIKRSPIAVVADTEYRLQFSARTSTGTALMKYGSNTSIGNNYVMNGTAVMNNNWQNFSQTFIPVVTGDIYLAFNFGDILGTFYLDNVQLTENCACPDTDTDTVCDDVDLCPGFDDLADADADGVPDGCDLCAGFDDQADADGDGVPDGCDLCSGFDDQADADGDGVANGCDTCAGFDDQVDADGDGVPNGCDLCFGFDDEADADGDGVPDGCDLCPGFDDEADADGDGIPDGCEEDINCELVTNGLFDQTLIPWVLKNFSSATGTVALTASGFVKIDVTTASTSNWHLGLRQYGILLQQGETYEVSYTAYAEQLRDIDIIMTNETGSQYAYHSKSLSTTPTTYTYQFTMNAPTNSNALVNLNVGADLADVYFDDVTIQDMNCDGCILNLQLNDHVIFEGMYQVENSIESNGIINQPDHVVFKANEIILDLNFEVAAQATFDALISPCQ